jgi:hypothetical protein
MSIECPVCTVSLSDAADRPADWVPCVLNPCAHIVCLGCTEMIERKKCPVCRDSYISVLPLIHLVSNNAQAVEAVRAWRAADVPPEEPVPTKNAIVSRTERVFCFPANTRAEHVDMLFESRQRIQRVRHDRLIRNSISAILHNAHREARSADGNNY